LENSLDNKFIMDYTKYTTTKPDVKGFFDADTNTISYVVSDPVTKKAAIIDSVMDFDHHGAGISFENADALIAYVQEKGLTVDWILETHIHADHLSAAPYLKDKVGGKMGIGEHIKTVQGVFGKIFNHGTEYEREDVHFDVLFKDGDTFDVGEIPAFVIHTPGHTPADVVYVIGSAVFAGDTIFMHDFGTARCDFPGGNAAELYDSIQKIFALPDEMRLFTCHDYLPEGREEFAWETTVGDQRKYNVHVKEGVDKDSFVQKRQEKDTALGMPRLIIPAIQVNIRGGKLPEADAHGNVHLKTPINSVFAKKKG